MQNRYRIFKIGSTASAYEINKTSSIPRKLNREKITLRGKMENKSDAQEKRTSQKIKSDKAVWVQRTKDKM